MLFAATQEWFYYSIPRYNPTAATPLEKKLLQSFDNQSQGHLLIAFVTGKNKLRPKVKKAFRELNLYHLFTPSGLHLSSLYLFLRPVLSTLKHWPFMRLLVEFFLALLPFGFATYYSLKRMALLRIIALFKKQYRLNFSLYYCYMFIFVFDFIWGTYRYSPLSYAYSFIFLGIILSSENPLKTGLPYALFGGQIIAAFFGQEPLLYTAFFFGFILTAIFTLIFPPLLLYYAIGSFSPFNWSEWILKLFEILVIKSHELSQIIGYFNASLPLIFIVFIFSLRRRRKINRLIPILLLIHSQPAQNLPLRGIKHELNLNSYIYKSYKNFN